MLRLQESLLGLPFSVFIFRAPLFKPSCRLVQQLLSVLQLAQMLREGRLGGGDLVLGLGQPGVAVVQRGLAALQLGTGGAVFSCSLARSGAAITSPPGTSCAALRAFCSAAISPVRVTICSAYGARLAAL